MKNRMILRAGIILMTIVSVILALSSGNIFKNIDLPEEKFVNISMVTGLRPKGCDSDTGEFTSGTSDTGYDIFDVCENPVMTMNISASGTAFRQINNKTYILSADHFCRGEKEFLPSFLIEMYNIKKDIWVSDYRGVSRIAEITYTDSQTDLCILESTIPIDGVLNLSHSIPNLGDKVYAISAPSGIHEKDVYLHFEGIFSGCNSRDVCFYTIPAAPGSSGSLVLNEHNRIIGMIQMVPMEFNSLSMGVGVKTIRNFLKKASEETGIDFN